VDGEEERLVGVCACVREQVIADAMEHGAAVLGMPMKATVKVRSLVGQYTRETVICGLKTLVLHLSQESEDGKFVLRTIPRSRLWEIQTPQVGPGLRGPLPDA
jgi:2-C-methyl-D-erythritol 4-phosphate cytidylyltransferase